ncbi:MAG TPA: glycoside hydrolase family 2 protein [Lentimicrobium sp.]|nr:glycoside hydrolase family 2 protein [Lentimicrobium sp.]
MLENWEFRQAGSTKWYPATVPGTVHTDLMNAGLIPDPFFRDNERSLQWIDKVNWEYRTQFVLDKEWRKTDKLQLFFEGLDTYADIFLNGKLIFSGKNMFVPAAVYIDPATLPDNNELTVYFKSPVIEGFALLEEYGLALPADNDQSEAGGMGPVKVSVFTRKAPYHFGWDWGPRLVTSGIWRPVYLKPVNSVHIKDVFIKQQSISKSRALLEIEVEMDLFTKEELTLNIDVNGNTVKSIPIKEDKTESGTPKIVKIPITIENPVLWWPNGHGKQELYKITASVVKGGVILDSILRYTGLRSVELVRQPQADGETFYFRINGKPIFAKGANYIPSDVFLPRVTPDKYESILSSAADAHINMLRVWGGGIYENDLFYDLCDKYGIMVWQDFMFACAMYPGDKEFLDQVTGEAVSNIKRLRNHSSIVLWCGNNEIEQAWGQYEEKRGWGWKERYNNEERQTIWKAYDTIFHSILPGAVKQLDPGIPYWHSSPSAGMGKLASHTTTSGDIHYWGVWHGREPVADFTKYKARFMSEYGFQSFPEFESVKNYTDPGDWNINSDVMKAHQRSGIGNQRILDYMVQSFKVPSEFEELLYTSQLLQAYAIDKAIRYHRSEMPYCMGSLFWQLNDCWPAASWSGIDYYGQWKALHYFAREAFKSTVLFIDLKGDAIVIKGVSDKDEATKAVLNLNLMDFYGKSLWNRPYQVTLPANGSKVLATIETDKIPVLQHKTDALLYVTLTVNGKVIESQKFYFSEPKELKLPFPDVNIHIREKPGRYDLEITSKNLCKNLMLVSEGNAYAFSDNFFDLLPGETRVVTVESDLPYSEFFNKLSYLHLK